MKKANYVVFDCETGGFDEKESPITQIALVGLDGETLEEINRFEMYIKPYDNLVIGKKALDVTGLKMVDINNGEKRRDAVKLITKFCKDIQPNNRKENKCILVGHNVQFDIKFLNELFTLSNKNLYDVVSPTSVCTMVDSKRYSPEGVSLELGECCKRVGIKLDDAHKAMNDTLATADLFRFYSLVLSGNTKKLSEEKTESKKSRLTFQF